MASEHTLVTTEEQWQDAMVHIGQRDELCMDTETDGLVWHRNKVCSVQIGTGDRSFYFPFRHKEGPNLDEGKLRHLAEAVLTPDRPQKGFHYSFDVKVMAKEGMKTPAKMRDPMLGAHLMNENEDAFKMEALAAKYLDPSYADAERELIDVITARFDVPEKGAKGHLHKLPADLCWKYGLQDIDTTWELDDFYRPHLETWKLDGLYSEVNDFAMALADMEKEGVLIDQDALRELGDTAEPKAEALEAQLQEWARRDLEDPDFPANPRSHPQMKYWLGSMLGIPNTSKETLKQTGPDPRAQLLLDYRVWQKLKSSFVDPYWGFIADDGRIHPGIYITTPGTRQDNSIRGTASSRLSMSRPNLQQVPPAVKKVFNAPPGYSVVELDYSQAELRLNAHYWAERFGDLSLGRLLLAGEDMHARSAANAGIPRKAAKIRNFAIEYGAGAARLASANQTDINMERRYLNGYFKLFPGSRMLMQQAQYEAESRGYIRLWTGRVVHFNHPRARSFTAKNRLIQGGVAEMLRRAITRVKREVPEAIMVLTVHDSIVFYIPTPIVRPTVHKLRAIMQDQPWCTLPMVVDASFGPTWGDQEDLPRDPVGIPASVMALTTDPTLQRAA